MNWNCYLIKVIRFKIKPKEDNRWILVEIKRSLILRVVSNKI